MERYIDCINCGRVYVDLRTRVSRQSSQQPRRHTIIDPPHPCRNVKQTAPLRAYQHHHSSRRTYPRQTRPMAYQRRRNIEKSGPEFYSVRWSLEEGDENRRMLVHREQVRAYFRFDAALR